MTILPTRRKVKMMTMVNDHKSGLFERGMGAAVTQLDVIKTLAVAIMICDHVGAYFFDNIDLFRSIGRIGLPVWFFLAGYGKARQLPFLLVAGAIFLVGVDVVTCQAILPLNALISIIVVRYSMDFIAAHFLKKWDMLFLLCAVMALLLLLPFELFEYGPMAFMLGISGYLARHYPGKYFGKYWGYHLYALGVVMAAQIINFEFDWINTLVMLIGFTMMFGWLLSMHRIALPANVFYGAVWRFGGRYTLEIYVVHITLFCIAAFFLFPDARTCFQILPVK
jgi:hypothetical protein